MVDISPSQDIDIVHVDALIPEIDKSHVLREEPNNFTIGGTRFFWTVKRLWDIFVAAIMLVVVLIMAPVIWLINFRYNPGPLFYRQERAGVNLAPFRIWKFRTMIGKSDVTRFAPDESDRITSFGHFLRKTHIDELPQSINILIGEMSVVGPRPEQRRFVTEYLDTIPLYKCRYLVRPGVTGLAQVQFGYTHTHKGTETKLKYDLFYIRKSGFRMEFCVYYKTIILLSKKLFNKA